MKIFSRKLLQFIKKRGIIFPFSIAKNSYLMEEI